MSEQIQHIPLAHITPGDNDRKVFEQAEIENLAESIRQHGFKGAIVLRKTGEFLYRIVAGERRFRAVTHLGWKTIPALVYPMTDEEESAMMLAENMARKNLNPIEEANAYQKRIAQFGWTPEQIAEKAGVKSTLVEKRLPLIKLVWEAQHLVATGNLPLGIAESMTRLDTNRQRVALNVYNKSDGMSVSKFRALVSQLEEEQNQESLFQLEDFWIKQVVQDKAAPKRGKDAKTGAPVRADIPQPKIAAPTDTNSAVIDRFIADLLAAGFTAEAGAVGTVYDFLVKTNGLSVPDGAKLLS